MRVSLFAAAVAVALAVAPAAAQAKGKLKVQSTDLKPNGTIAEKHVFNGFGCSGENVSPQLSWSGAPEGTKSFVVTAYDPDAPTGSGWWHWVVYDLPADTKELAQGAGGETGQLPAGAKQGRTDFGKPGYGGPCPPPGDKPHRYIFTVSALKVDKLDVPADASPAMIGFMTHMNLLDSGQLTAKYSRKK